MAIFLIIAAAAFSMFNQNVTLATHQQTLSSVNIGLRNAMSQIEMDVSGAGENVLGNVQGATGAFSPGVIIQNNVPGIAAACAPNAATWGYPASSACFDSLSTITVKQCTINGETTNAPVLAVDEGTSPNNQVETLSASTQTWANDPNGAAGPGLANEVSCYTSGDEMLVLQIPTGGNNLNCDNALPNGATPNFCVGVYTLSGNASITANPDTGNSDLLLTHNAASAASDPLGIIFNSSGTNNYKYFNSLDKPIQNGSYVIDLGTGTNDVTFAVLQNPANADDTELVRCPTAAPACNAVNGQVLADQVIGFKVGADLWSATAAGNTDLANYSFNSFTYCNSAFNVDCTLTPQPAAGQDPYDYSLVRSVRVSLIGRTAPGQDSDLTKFKNGFDGGPYLVQQASVVVNLRGISISAFGN
jgi:hypothetical protein